MNATISTGWRRVTKADRCPVCTHDSWCCIGQRYINCMRVQSPKPCENGGWLHAIEGAQKVEIPSRPAPAPSINCTAMLKEWQEDFSGPSVFWLADRLAVDSGACAMLGAVWAPPHRAWAWPMFDAYRNAVGIRLRDDSGRKWAVKGSHHGLFLPAVEPKETAYVCEGPTDTAAALSMGLFAVGRPSCRGCEVEINRLFRRLDTRRVVIIADLDDPGWQGARALAAVLPMPSVILMPPAKDVREFYRNGGSGDLLQAMAAGMVWSVPKCST